MQQYDNQNFWQLASIQGAALGIPVMFVGKHLANQYGLGVALTSIFVGNLILWIIAVTMFTMTYRSKKNASHAIENVKSYFGNKAAILAAIMLMFAFISWFPVQIDSSITSLDKYLNSQEYWNSDFKIRLGAFSACIITFVSMGGIRAIKWICVVCFPFLLSYAIFQIVANFNFFALNKFEWKFIFPAIVSVLMIIFPGIINLPTFFRHSRSHSDGILGLALMTIFVIIFQSASIGMLVSSDAPPTDAFHRLNFVGSSEIIFLISFIALTTLCINIVNIYFASAALEAAHPNFADPRGYALIGLVGTLVYGLIQVGALLDNVQTLTNNFIGSLGIMLLIGYVYKLITKHRPRHFEMHINVLCWVVGCIVSIPVFYVSSNPNKSFMYGVMASAFAFILILFFEELIWAIMRKSKARSIDLK